MKPISIFSIVGQLMFWPAMASGAPPMRDSLTREQLNEAYQKALQKNPVRNIVPAENTDPAAAGQPKSLLSRSEIICFGGAATLVPKRAILNCPPKLAERLKLQEGSKFMNWQAFYQLNHAWITTVEVTRMQAEGNQPLDEELIERIQKSTNLVVATYKAGPISVLPLKETAKAAETSNDNP